MTTPLTTEYKLTFEQLDDVGELADTCDNLIAASQLPMPADFHVTSLREALASVRDELRALYIKVAGDNPWK